MGELFSSVMFNGRDLLMQADAGASSGGAPGTGDGLGGKGSNGQAGDTGDEGEESEDDGDGSDEEEDSDEDNQGDDLDLPQFSKRQVAQIVSGRINDIKKGFANYKELQEVAQLIGEITGNRDINAIVNSIRQLHAQHRAKTGQPPVAQPPVYQQPIYQPPVNPMADAKRKATEAEFDNSFSKQPEYSDAVLFRDEIIDLAQNGFTLAQAYWAVAGPLAANKKADAAARQATQAAQARQQSRKAKQVMPGATGTPGGGGKPTISPEIRKMAEKLGMDPEEYVAWSGVNTFDQAQALRGKNKK